MNDNLRYISLQYIKGYNYEKITCFHSDDIIKIKAILKFPYIEKNYETLEKILNVEKRDIGESLLDDLINYISLKDLKKYIEDAIKAKQKELETNKKNIDVSINKIEALKKIINNLKIKKNALNEDNKQNLVDFDNLLHIYNITEEKYKNFADYNDEITEDYLFSLINKKEDIDVADKSTQYEIIIYVYICQNIKKFKDRYISLNKDDFIKFVNDVLYFLTILKNLESSDNDNDNVNVNNNLEKLIKIFKKFLYICKNNIKKYERIFDHNEIGNIDEAFMIKSYSSFLKKLHKLKQNLENKDTEKIKRELINYFDKFFNLHGINNPEKNENKAEINYIVQRILNYT
jgi:hypothetical protein